MPADLKSHFEIVNKAIVDGDARKFASLVYYPLKCDYPLKWIEDSTEMVARFSTIIDDSIRNIFKKVKPEDWRDEGWRGYSIRDGDFWDNGDGIYK